MDRTIRKLDIQLPSGSRDLRNDLVQFQLKVRAYVSAHLMDGRDRTKNKRKSDEHTIDRSMHSPLRSVHPAEYPDEEFFIRESISSAAPDANVIAGNNGG
ncbi:MAG: hypothetical protein AABZ39_07175 [Spirochaetota bacterium]